MPNLPRQVTRFAAALLATAGAALAAAPSSAPGSRTFTPADKPPPPPPAPSPELVKEGTRVFRGACIGCHGEKGDGQGREGKLLPIPPRDFTVGQFISRSTPSGSLPLDADLFRSIRRGFRPEVGMPPFTFLTDREVWAAISYLKTFSDRWKSEEVPPPVEVPSPPPRTAQRVAEGAKAYKEIGCFQCHGETGRGDGPSAAALLYDNGKPVRTADFTRPQDFKVGSSEREIFRTLTVGMDGTPMPSFAESLTVDQRWNLVYFIKSLGEQK
ncbi:MAG: cytochrome c [Myxococcales bacterium]|nr:cytochrome c [Myxococcales bacterium]